MNRDRGGERHEALQITIGTIDHEMNIQRQRGVTGYRFDDGGPKGDVVHKVTIHHIAMNPICSCRSHPLNLVAQPAEVAGKNRGCNDDFTRKHMCGIPYERGNCQR